MAFKIVRNDITKMNTEAIVNTANDHAFITPGFKQPAQYIIHAVSPDCMGESEGEEEKLRSCYRQSLQLAEEHGIKSIAFPLIVASGSGYPEEEGVRIAIDEIYAFLTQHEMDIYLVVSNERTTSFDGKIDPNLEAYIDRKYMVPMAPDSMPKAAAIASAAMPKAAPEKPFALRSVFQKKSAKESAPRIEADMMVGRTPAAKVVEDAAEESVFLDFETEHESKLEERMKHVSDTFSEYLLYLIRNKNMENAEVYKRAIVDKKIFSKIKNNADYHPQKLTALCLCVGAKLNLDESKDLLARAGYALSPCDKTDIIFSYFIENEIYDMIELDIQLEEHGLPCIIS